MMTGTIIASPISRVTIFFTKAMHKRLGGQPI